MEIVSAISGAFSSLLDFLKPAEDVVHVYDIKKENANASLYVILGVLLILAIGVILAIVLTR